MDDSNNYDDQPTLAQAQNAAITFPVFISVVGIISVALAVMLYHLILLRYCRHHHYYHHSSEVAIVESHNHRRNMITEEASALAPVSWFGLDDRALEAIPVLPYCEWALDFFRIEQSECVVCLGKLERGERVRWLPGCAHAFHVACIDGWLRARASCPTCRAPVVVPPPLLRQFVGGAAFVNVNGGGMTRARSGGALRRGGVGKVEVADSDSVSLGLKRSLSVDHTCVVNVGVEGGEGDRVERDFSSSSVVSSTTSRMMEWRPTGLMRSIFGLKAQDGDHGILPY